MANLALGQRRFQWLTIGLEPRSIAASNGVLITPEHLIHEADLPERFDVLFVCGSNPVPHRIEASVLGWLRGLAMIGMPLGGICTGSYWLARAGLLDGYHCTLHWEDADRFLSDFPRASVSSRLFEIDRDRFTCSGGVAPVDMMLSLMAGEGPASRKLADMVAELMVCERIRTQQDMQRVPLRMQLGARQPKLQEAVLLMESNIEEPLNLDEIAGYVQLSSRQLERLFRVHLQCTPRTYYLRVRLQRAQRMLRDTHASIIDVATACGFSSVSHFTERYRQCFGISPGRERRADATVP